MNPIEAARNPRAPSPLYLGKLFKNCITPKEYMAKQGLQLKLNGSVVGRGDDRRRRERVLSGKLP